MEEKKNFSNRDDLRTLFIAFLTTLIMLAFYHIGMTVCKMKQECARPQCIVVKADPCPMKRFGHREFGRHHMENKEFRQEKKFAKGKKNFRKAAPVKAPVNAAAAAEAKAK